MMLVICAGAVAISTLDMASAMAPCVTQSSTPQCASYQYPEDSVVRDIEDNCAAMPWMIACGVWQACQAGKISGTSPYCSPFSVLASSCVDKGMQSMSGCLAYTQLCKADSKVKQCTDHPPIPRVVHTSQSQV
jgi:hypothetical protein